MTEEPLPHYELREMRVFMKRMMTFWTVIFPFGFMSKQLVDAIQQDSWFLGAFAVGLWAFVMAFAWQIRRALHLLMDAQDVREEVGVLELRDRKARAEQRIARRERAEVRLARIHQQQEHAEHLEAVDDMLRLLRRLDSDRPSPPADT